MVGGRRLTSGASAPKGASTPARRASGEGRGREVNSACDGSIYTTTFLNYQDEWISCFCWNGHELHEALHVLLDPKFYDELSDIST